MNFLVFLSLSRYENFGDLFKLPCCEKEMFMAAATANEMKSIISLQE